MDSGSKEGLWPHKSPLLSFFRLEKLGYRKISAIGKRKRNATRRAMCNICFLFRRIIAMVA
jgi:hypothetical protein